LYLLRHALSVLILPTTVVVFVPVWIAREWHLRTGWPDSVSGWLVVCAGSVALAMGLALFVASLHHLASEGRGTLAPWDPPRRLVVRGPYRYVRNPMISGVIFLLAGLALCLRSVPHAIWAGIFVMVNLIFIPLVEEPDLEHRFGDDYRAYCRVVPRLIPRLTSSAAQQGDSSTARRTGSHDDGRPHVRERLED
jgi:protein-S-isoprenylcysteine O-methyltransferase Ste14